MEAQSNNKRIWQIEITFNDTKPPHLYMMTNFTNTRSVAMEQLKRQVKWFKPETIKSAHIVEYKLSALDSIDASQHIQQFEVKEGE